MKRPSRNQTYVRESKNNDIMSGVHLKSINMNGRKTEPTRKSGKEAPDKVNTSVLCAL